MDEEHNFISDRNMADSIKIDASILTPEQDKWVKNISKQVSSTLRESYAQFVPKETLKRTKDIEDRIIVTDQTSFEVMHTDWDTLSIKPAQPEEGVKGTYFVQGGIMAFENPSSLWNIFPQNVQHQLIDQFGSEAKAKDVAVSVSFTDLIAHEITHQYQDSTLPENFLECAVRFYQREVTDKLHLGHFIEDISEERINFYKEMTDKYKNDIHSLFFGGEVDANVRSQILQEFELQSERLFPKN